MIRKAFFIVSLNLFAFQVFAQNVAVVNGAGISSKEFMWVYKKNHTGVTHPTYQDLSTYLDLYINFKLKVADAKAMKMDVDTNYKQEIEGYERALKTQKKISTKSAEYGYILNEYREGVLMFNVSEQKIWNKAQDDDAELRSFYQKNSVNYGGKSFDEIRGQIISDYQQFLEAEWIKNLKTKYSVKVNSDELKKLAKL